MSVIAPPPVRVPEKLDPELRLFLTELSRTVQLMWDITKGGSQSTIATLALTDVSGTGDDTTINANIVLLETAVNGLKSALDSLGVTQ